MELRFGWTSPDGLNFSHPNAGERSFETLEEAQAWYLHDVLRIMPPRYYDDRPYYGFKPEGECATCDSFFPYGPTHDGCRHGAHCTCGD